MSIRDLDAPSSESLCSDCNASQHLKEVAPGINILQILHDTTCPWLAHAESR